MYLYTYEKVEKKNRKFLGLYVDISIFRMGCLFLYQSADGYRLSHYYSLVYGHGFSAHWLIYAFNPKRFQALGITI